MKTRNQSVSFDLTLFRKNLMHVRTARGMGIKELGQKAGFKAKNRVYDLEDGEGRRGTPSLDEIVSVCQVLDVAVDDMLFKQAILTLTFAKPVDAAFVKSLKS